MSRCFLTRDLGVGSCPASHSPEPRIDARLFPCPECGQIVGTYMRAGGPWLILGHDDVRGPTLAASPWIAEAEA